MDLRKALVEILEIASFKRIDEVTKLLSNGGVVTADDLKYFDWNSLKELGNLSTMEVNEIMGYVQKKFPEEYEEHKRKRTEERKLKNEVEILNFKADHEMKLQQQKMELEKEMKKILKEQQEMEEQLKRSQEQRDASKGKASLWTEKSKQYWNDIKKYATKSESSGMKDDFPKDCKKQAKRGNIEAQTEEAILKRDDGLLKMKDSSKMSIEEAVTKIFRDSGPAAINHVISAMKNRDIHMAAELKYYERDSLEDMGLIDEEIDKIMAFVQEKFSKIYKKHEITRDEVNIMYEQLSKHGAQINELFKLAKRSREKKAEDVETQEKQSSSQAEATELRQKMDESSSSNSEDQTQTTYSNHLQEEPQKSSCLSSTAMLNRGRKSEILQTWGEHSNSQAEKYYSNDRCKDTNSNINTRFPKNCENFKNKLNKYQEIQAIEEDFKEIELPIEEAVAKILEGCNSSRLIFVTRTLMEEGAQNSKELKFFNRNSLEELGVLEKEEIDKILKFIQES